MTTPPVVFVVFNRPEPTSRVLARIRDARPARLHVVCDGPRAGREGDVEKVAAVRRLIAEGIDWPCEVTRDYADTNLGCRHRVASGLNRAFELLEEAIILEDDCLPDPGFFRYCAEMLARYRDDPAVLHVGGTNLAPSRLGPSYRFTRHPWIWGWATWRRAWRLYDFEMREWDARRAALRASFASAWEAQYWISNYDRVRSDPRGGDTWDFQWAFTVRSRGGLCLMPRMNLVENLGIGPDATHTKSDAAHLRRASAPFPARVTHPRGRAVDRFADEAFTRAYCRQTGLAHALRSRLRVWREGLRAASSP